MRRALLAGGVVLALLLAACGDGESGGRDRPVRPLAAEAERLHEEEGGAPLVRSTVRVRFDGPVEPVSLRALHLAFRLTPPEDSPLARHPLGEMPLERVEQSGSRVVTLTVRNLIASGSMLHVRASAFREGAEGELTIPVASRFTPLGVALAAGTFAFADPGFVAPRPRETPLAADRDPVLVRAALEAHLDRRGASAGVREAALVLYDGMDPEVAPAPKVRAALAALAGTFADAAVGSLLGPENCTGAPAAFAGFREPPGDASLAARVTHSPEGRRIISIRPDLEATPFELLMPLLAHEAIHCDRLDSLEEEIVASAIDVFLYIHLLVSQPELARDPSPLARNLNIEALAMLNSGRALPESLGVLASPHGREALPDSGTVHRSFADLIAAAYTEGTSAASPVEPVAQRFLDALAEALGLPLGNAFNLVYVDSLLGRAATFEAISNLLSLFGLVPA